MIIEEVYHNNHQFHFCHNKTSFKMTTDSVLLADFVNINHRDKLLVDFGTGLGTIPLLLSSRSSIKMIGIEMNNTSAELAKKSVEYNNLQGQIDILLGKIQDSSNYITNNSVDIVVSNPPYFKMYEGSYRNMTEEKTLARHEIAITWEELAKEANRMLKDQGKFVFVHRVERFIEIIEILKKYKLEPKRIKMIHDTVESNAVIFLLEAVKNGKNGIKFEAPIILKEKLYE